MIPQASVEDMASFSSAAVSRSRNAVATWRYEYVPVGNSSIVTSLNTGRVRPATGPASDFTPAAVSKSSLTTISFAPSGRVTP